MGVTRTALAALVAAGLAGCASERAPDAPPGERASGRVGLSLADLDPAIEALAAKLDERNARGWPASIRLSDGAPRAPVARIEVVNRTTGSLDKDALAGRIGDALLARGTLAIEQGDAGDPGYQGLVLRCSVSEERVQTEAETTATYTVTTTLAEPPDGPPLVMSMSRLARSRAR